MANSVLVPTIIATASFSSSSSSSTVAGMLDQNHGNASLVAYASRLGISAINDIYFSNSAMTSPSQLQLIPTANDDDLNSLSIDINLNHESADVGVGEKVISNILLPLVCLCGIAGILLTIIVLSQKHMSTSTNCYLLALSSTDLVFLAMLTVSLIHMIRFQSSDSHIILQVYINFAPVFMKIALMASIWLTVMLAVERYVAICQPFLAAKVCTITRARLLCLGVFLLSLVCHLPPFWEQKIMSHYDKNSSRLHVWIGPTELATNQLYRTVYPWIVDGVLLSIAPFILLLLLNTRLIWEVRKSTAYMQRHLNVASSTAQREEMQVTVMLILVVIVFFICQAPYVAYTALLQRHETNYREQEEPEADNIATKAGSNLLLFHAITKLLLTLKSAVNFVIYCWFSEKFRATLKRIFHPHHCCACFFKGSFSGQGQSQGRGGSYYASMRSYNYTTYTTREATTSL